ERPRGLRLMGVPNGRLADTGRALARLDQALGREDGEWGGDGEGVDPAVLASLAQRCGYWLGLTWSGPRRDHFEAVFVDAGARGSGRFIDVYLPDPAAERDGAGANHPVRRREAGAVAADVKRYLSTQLPDYMVPA